MKEDVSLFQYELSIAVSIKNEAPYMVEWIDYHRLAGVDHFYIYDNDSEDNLKEVLQPYIASGVVDYIPFPGKVAQHAVFNDVLQKYRFASRYIAFIDADEFIFPKTDDSIKAVLHDLLDKNPHFSSLVISWNNFGSSGLEKAELDKPVLERFLHREPDDANSYFKSIVNPRCVYTIGHIHFAEYFSGQYAINEKGDIAFHQHSPHLLSRIVINHYFTKSREEYLNEIFDDGIVRYRDKLRESDTHTHTRGV